MLRNLTLRQPVAIGKPQHGALAIRQRLEREPQAERLVGRDGELLGRPSLVDRIDLGRCHAQRAPAIRIERGVACDAADPGAGGPAVRIERARMPPDAANALLGRVLCGLRLAQHAQAGAVDRTRVAVVQLRERDAIAARRRA